MVKGVETPCTGGVGGLADTGGRDAQQSIFLTPSEAGATVFSCVELTFTSPPKLSIMSSQLDIAPEKCDAGSNKAESKEQIHLGKCQ